MSANTQPTTRPRFFTILEAATELRVSEGQIRRMVANGSLPKVPRLGRRVVIPVQALDALAAEAFEG